MDLAANRDADPQVRAEASEGLRRFIARLTDAGIRDDAELAHRHALRDDITRFLDRPDQPRTQPKLPEVPPGPPRVQEKFDRFIKNGSRERLLDRGNVVERRPCNAPHPNVVKALQNLLNYREARDDFAFGRNGRKRFAPTPAKDLDPRAAVD